MRAGAALVATLVAACSMLPQPDQLVRVDAGVQPRLTPAEVTVIVTDQIHLMESIAGRIVAEPRIRQITVTRADQVAGFEPNAQQGMKDASVVWVVQAQGTFASLRGAPLGGNEIPVAASGFMVISDADGTVVGLGFP